MKLYSIPTFLVIAFCLLVTYVFAQPIDRVKTEAEYLTKARNNIERYRKNDAVVRIVDKNGKPIKGALVKINQVSQDFLFGALCEDIFNANSDSVMGEKFKTLFKDLFNFTVIDFKWRPYEPVQGRVQWQKKLGVLAWCKENNITVKGHTLGWTNHSGIPVWLQKLPGNVAFDLYKARIHNIVGGYKSQIKIWDIVNEPITTIPWEKAFIDTLKGIQGIDVGNRYNVKGITQDETLPWVTKSYQWAQEADPTGDFILNEFYQIAKPEVREKFFRFVKALQEQNVPVKGIGLQAHEPREMWFSPIEFYKALDLYTELKLPIHITEFIPQSSGKTITGGWREGTWTEEAQAEFAEQFYTLAFGHPSVVSFNWWGFSDKMIWLEGGGLIDKDFNPKPVYHRLKKLIKEDWMTRNISVQTNKNGTASWRGFFGNYEIQVTVAGEEKVFRFHLGKDGGNSVTFSL